MRCGCPVCGAYMAHSGVKAVCVCAACGHECRLCTGKDTAPAIRKEKDGRVHIPETVIRKYENEL